MNNIQSKAKYLFASFFRDENGEVVIAQRPNLPIVLAFSFWLLSNLNTSNDVIDGGTYSLARAFLFLWAYQELASGVNLFRKFLGLSVLIFIIMSYFGFSQ